MPGLVSSVFFLSFFFQVELGLYKTSHFRPHDRGTIFVPKPEHTASRFALPSVSLIDWLITVWATQVFQTAIWFVHSFYTPSQFHLSCILPSFSHYAFLSLASLFSKSMQKWWNLRCFIRQEKIHLFLHEWLHWRVLWRWVGRVCIAHAAACTKAAWFLILPLVTTTLQQALGPFFLNKRKSHESHV